MTAKAFRRDWIGPWVGRIARLKAWGSPQDDVKVTIHVGLKEHSTGRCRWSKREIHLTVGTDPVDAIATVIHEFAHAAAPPPIDQGHGDAFKERLRAATIELTGVDPGLLDNYRVFQRAVEHAVSLWWRAHHERAWKTAQKFEALAGGGR